MATMVSVALERSIENGLSPHLISLAAKKLARRLGKLETERSRLPTEDTSRAIYDLFFHATEAELERILKRSSDCIQRSEERFWQSVVRVIPKLSQKPRDGDEYLEFPASGQWLGAFWSSSTRALDSSCASSGVPMDDCNGPGNALWLAQRLHGSVDLEYETTRQFDSTCLARTSKQRVATHSVRLREYIDNMYGVYNGSPEHMSLMILVALGIWVQMDMCAVIGCPLLAQYSPPFTPESLDFLHSPTIGLMERLCKVQSYLDSRRAQ
jgi:hypothetical protein